MININNVYIGRRHLNVRHIRTNLAVRAKKIKAARDLAVEEDDVKL